MGVCVGASGGGNPTACDIASGGGEGWQLKSTVFGTAPAPRLTFTANPLTVASGGASSLAWIGTNVTSCTASGAWSGAQATSGTQATGALTVNSTFNLDCTGPGGSISRSVTVTVAPPPALTFTANPTTVVGGSASSLAWTATNVTSCIASGAWSGATAPSGTQSTGALTVNSTFGLDCTGPGGPISGSVTVTVTAPPPPAPTLTFTANPLTVASGSASSLAWIGTNVDSCTASGAWSGAQATSGTQATGALTVNSTFNLDCTGPGGSISRSVTVTVAPPPALTFTANPATVASGSASSLAWTGTNVTSCTASGAWSGAKAASGTQSTGALTVNSTFSLDCSGPGGQISGSVTVTVTAPPPALTLAANPTTLASGSASTLTWSSTNASSCTASGGWSGSKALSGSQSTGALTVNTTFTLDCSGAGGSISKSVAVAVTPVSTSGLAVFTCTTTSAGSFSSCAWPSQWRLTSPAAVTDSNMILYCPAGTAGNQDISACSGARWTTKPLIPAQGLVGVCVGGSGGGNPAACDIGAGGGEGWALKSTVFGTGGTTPAPTLTLTANPQIMASGTSSTLTWSSTDASSCTASGAWSGAQAVSGTRSTGVLTGTSTFSLACIGAGGSTLQSVTITVTPPPAPVGTNFGLEFPGDGAVRRMLFWHNPFPIYDATYIFKVYPRKKLVPSNSPTGYYTTFFWGNDGTFIWDGGNGNTYYGAHPYPIPAPDGPGQWEIAVESGDDVTGSEVVWDRWYTQAFRAWRESPTVTHHEFYWDLPDTSKVITHTVTDPAWAATNPPTPAIVIGQSPNVDGVSWGGYPGWEEFNGIIRGIQMYSGLLSVQDILTEIATPMSTTAGQNLIWYLNLNPRPSDVTDKKGLGIPNDPSWDGTTALEWTE